MRLLLLLACLPGAFAARAATLGVGPGQPYARIMDAYKAAKDGDTIAVLPLPNGQAYKAEELQVKKARLRFVALRKPGEPRVKIDGSGGNYEGVEPHPRAIFQFNPGADGCLVEGFELFKAHNSTANGAGVRVNEASHVTIRDCEIRDCDMGMMANGDVRKGTMANLRVEFCEVHHNGDDGKPGLNHNFYLGGTSVTLHGCDVHHPTTGHNVKSRAHHTRVEFCFVHDSLNREFDLVDGHQNTEAPNSDAVLLGNLVVKSPNCDNGGTIHFGQDVGSPHNGRLYLVHNTIVTYSRAPVVTLSAAGASLSVLNNVVWQADTTGKELVLAASSGGGKVERSEGRNNWFGPRAQLPAAGLAAAGNYLAPGAERPPFVDPAKYDYRLGASNPLLVDVGLDLKELVLPGVPGGPPAEALELRHYIHPLQTEPRAISGHPDLGAYELGAGQGQAVASASRTAEAPAPTAQARASKTPAASEGPPVDAKAQAALRLRWRERLVARVAQGVKDGARPRAYLSLFGDKAEAVKIQGADQEGLQLAYNGNQMAWTWKQVQDADLLGLAQVYCEPERAPDNLLLGSFLWMAGRNGIADEHFAKARLGGAEGVEEVQEELRAIFPAGAPHP
ncbi:MAG: right-handed parallel beta-helix repeat-containing protein [Planctomycetota bacterium]|nr:right-handed parallel beta-helix repeat-containing protein [Planctomycetota bacterium]